MDKKIRIGIISILIITVLIGLNIEGLLGNDEELDLTFYDSDKILVYSQGSHVFEPPRESLEVEDFSLSSPLPDGLIIFHRDWEISGRATDQSSNKVCAISGSAEVICWHDGENESVEVEVTSPSKILSEESAFVSIAAGDSHACGILMLASGESELYCWGSNSLWQLGDGTRNSTDSMNPVSVGTGNWTSLALGSGHSCGVLDFHDLFCWGSGTLGQLGLGERTYSPSPSLVKKTEDRIVSLEAGSHHTCALIEGGSIECWGWNGYGQLGVGDYIDRKEPSEVIGIKEGDGVQLSLGPHHSCIILMRGEVSCWGSNWGGQVSGLDYLDLSEPEIDSRHGSSVREISTSSNRTCSLSGVSEVICSSPYSEKEMDNIVTGKQAEILLPLENGVCWISEEWVFGCNPYNGSSRLPGLPVAKGVSGVPFGSYSMIVPEKIERGTIAGIPNGDFIGSFRIINRDSNEEIGNFEIEIHFGMDSDIDGWPDEIEWECNSNPFDAGELPIDTDGDSICNRFDDDDDGDGFADSIDRFPLDRTEWRDDDRDGIGRNADAFELSPGMKSSILTISILLVILIIEIVSIRQDYNNPEEE